MGGGKIGHQPRWIRIIESWTRHTLAEADLEHKEGMDGTKTREDMFVNILAMKAYRYW